MIIQRIECRIGQSAYALNTSELVQNAPDCEIHVEDYEKLLSEEADLFRC